VIIKKSQIEAIEDISKLHFLNKNARRINKSIGNLARLKNLEFHMIEVDPGYEATEFHSHYYQRNVSKFSLVGL